MSGSGYPAFVDTASSAAEMLPAEMVGNVLGHLSDRDKAQMYATGKRFNGMQWIDPTLAGRRAHFAMLIEFQRTLQQLRAARAAHNAALMQGLTRQAMQLLLALLCDSPENHAVTGAGHSKYHYYDHPDDPMTPQEQYDVRATVRKIEGESTLMGEMLISIFAHAHLMDEFVDALCTNVTTVIYKQTDCVIFKSSLDHPDMFIAHDAGVGFPVLVKNVLGRCEVYFRKSSETYDQWLEQWHSESVQPIFTKENAESLWDVDAASRVTTVGADGQTYYPLEHYTNVYKIGMMTYSMLYISYYVPAGGVNYFGNLELSLRGKLD